MKIKVRGKDETEIEYPCLMASTYGGVVLMGESGCGVVVKPASGINDEPVGHYSDDWFMDCFKPFHGTITLSND